MITDDEVLVHLRSINNKMFLFTYYLANGILAYLQYDNDRAVEHFKLAEENVFGVVAMMTNSQHKFYWSLALLTRLARSDPAELSEDAKREALEQVSRNQTQLDQWAQHAPANYRHKHVLVEALRTMVTGEHWLSMDLFDSAIEGAREGGFMQEEALARELAADFYFLRSTLSPPACVVYACMPSVCRVLLTLPLNRA
jgi:hypothetical protein